MSPEEIQAAAVARYRQAKDALKSGDIGQAIALFGQALELTPQSAQIRRALRDAQCLAIPQGQSLPKLTKLKLLKLKAQMKIMDAAGDWEHLVAVAEEAASINPWDIETNAATAAACLGMDYKSAAFVFYQRVAEQAPTNTKYLRRCATMLEATSQDEKAFEYWQRILKADPQDLLASKRVKQGLALGFDAPKQATGNAAETHALAARYLESDTVLNEGDTAHGDRQIPSKAPATVAPDTEVAPDSGFDPDSGLDPDSGTSADSGLDPDSGMSAPPEPPVPVVSRPGPAESPPQRSGTGEPPSAGPSMPPQKAGPASPPQKSGPGRPPSAPAVSASAVGPAGPPGTGPLTPPSGSGPSAAPSGAGASGGPRFAQSDLTPGAGPSAPPAIASAPSTGRPTRGTAESNKAFSVPIPDDMPDHVRNLLTVASSLVARDRSTEACSVLEKALSIAEGDEWIEGMLLLLKRRPR